jgi:hypothetical protein
MLYIITATSQLSVQNEESTIGPELEGILDSVTPSVLLMALVTILHQASVDIPV